MFRNAHAFPGAFFGYFIAQVQHNPVYGIVFVRQMISRCRINLQHSVCFGLPVRAMRERDWAPTAAGSKPALAVKGKNEPSPQFTSNRLAPLACGRAAPAD